MHAFTEFIRILARGPNLSRPLTQDEARRAMAAILSGEALPEQVGAFLMLMRYRTESPEELAGMTQAARQALGPQPAATVMIDWPSYADRHRQLPWFVLSALLLAQNGVKVLMHGIAGDTDGHVGTRTALLSMGLRLHETCADAIGALEHHDFSYLKLESALPALAKLFDMKATLGLRSPVHSVARELNPLRAPAQMQGVFHPNYRLLHLQAALMLQQPNAAIFKGGGGEAQRNPDKACTVDGIADGRPCKDVWPVMEGCESYIPREEPQDVQRIAALWRGHLDEAGPRAMVVGTTAIALKLIGKAEALCDAQALAESMWQNRDRGLY